MHVYYLKELVSYIVFRGPYYNLILYYMRDDQFTGRRFKLESMPSATIQHSRHIALLHSVSTLRKKYTFEFRVE